ncbi:Spy/CpxP family protein refolding chaperone [Thioalkalivibrio thiocyanodenitrificans]|uniref:Spy/CpxP family protein refolding chaperone n=1 Tax=Thioalkalivibrio thiocyanodenitrificans TaxID=243063 RepID=UPI000382B46C|nr:Spy/CpxP family protein refolding chaperone [Thioalkalivibrio thiocyanodenitrificans]
MKTTQSIRHLVAAGLLTLAFAPAAAWTAQHGMPMGDPDNRPMMQQRGGMGMMGPGAMMGGCPMMQGMMQGQGMGMMGRGGMGMMGPGGMMGHGGMGMMGPGGMGMMYGMDLDREQQVEMRRIQRELRRQNWERMGQLMEAKEDMHELMASESPDPAAVGQAHARMAELKRPMIEARVKAMNEMRALLTDEQRERMRSGPRGTGMMPGMQDGMGGGMGPGMRGGMQR